MHYGSEPAMPRRMPAPTASDAEKTEARMRSEIRDAGMACLRHRLLLRLYLIHDQGAEALAPLIAHFGWPARVDDAPFGDDERDALEELLLLCLYPRYPLMPRGEFVFQLFSLMNDTRRFATTRLGRKCVGVVGYQACTQILRDRRCTDREVNLLLAVWLRDRMCEWGIVGHADGKRLRLHQKDRVAMATRLGMPTQ